MDRINIKQTNECYYTYKLDNGLTVYFYTNKNIKNFYMALTTKFGAKDIEFKYISDNEYHKVPYGLAHFLEHITFHLDGKDADELFTPYGAYINAFTNYKSTSYVVGGNNNFDKCLDNLLYYVYTPYYTEETVKNEKGIIKEESKRNDDDPNRVFRLNRSNALYSKSNYTHKVVGDLDDIESISLQNINDAYDVFYHPSNMFLVISGNFDIEEAKKVIQERMDTFTFKDYKEYEVIVPDEPVEVKKDYYEYDANVLNSKVSYSLKVPANVLYATGLNKVEYETYLSLIFRATFGHTSNCYQELLDKKIVNTSPHIGISDVDNYYEINIVGSPLKGTNQEFIDIIEKYMSNISVNELEIRRKINSYKSSYLLSFDDNEDIVYGFIDDVIDYGNVIDNIIEVLDGFTSDKGEKLLKSIDFSNKTIVILNPIEDN